MSVDIRPMTATIGAMISNVDLRRPLDPADKAAIEGALLDHGVVFFRDQDITPDQQVAFAEQFGTISIPPMSPASELRPEVMELDQISISCSDEVLGSRELTTSWRITLDVFGWALPGTVRLFMWDQVATGGYHYIDAWQPWLSSDEVDFGSADDATMSQSLRCQSLR